MKRDEEVPRLWLLANDGDDVPEQFLTDLALGLGWGATDQARRWASMGKALEAEMLRRRPAHRPKQDPLTHKDALRAFAAWEMCWNLRRILGDPKAHFSNRELVRVIQLVEKALDIANDERLFPDHGNFDAALSRGRDILGIVDDWHCPVCEELQRTFPKTTG